jgi:hypothetical protein
VKGETMSGEISQNNGPTRPRLRFGLRTVLIGVAIVALVTGLLTTLAAMIGRAREAAARASCNLGGIALAFHNYQDEHGVLPPAVVRHPNGNPLYSWRVLVLPYIEQRELYQDFRLGEPWDSEHNLGLLERMPSSYEAPWTRYVKVPPYHTVCRVITGPGTLFEDQGGLRLPDDIPDGLANTLLFLEAGEPIPWTKPDEILYDPAQPVKLRGLFRDGFRACSADSRYRFIEYNMDQRLVHAVITRNGGENLPTDW